LNFELSCVELEIWICFGSILALSSV